MHPALGLPLCSRTQRPGSEVSPQSPLVYQRYESRVCTGLLRPERLARTRHDYPLPLTAWPSPASHSRRLPPHPGLPEPTLRCPALISMNTMQSSLGSCSSNQLFAIHSYINYAPDLDRASIFYFILFYFSFLGSSSRIRLLKQYHLLGCRWLTFRPKACPVA